VTLFEYLTAAHTLILAFAITRVLSGLADAASPGRRCWFHLSWIGMAIAFYFTAFWAFWSYSEVDWTMPLFFFVLLPIATMYVFGTTLIPSDPSTVESWRDYFFEKRVRIFSTGALIVVGILASNQVVLDVSPTEGSQFGLYVLLAIFCIGFASSSPRVHTVLALGPPVLFASILLIMARPGSLAQ